MLLWFWLVGFLYCLGFVLGLIMVLGLWLVFVSGDIGCCVGDCGTLCCLNLCLMILLRFCFVG